MSELLPPRTPVEYIVRQDSRRKPRVLVIVAASLTVLLIALAIALHWFWSKKAAVRTFPTARISASGLQGTLKAKWDGGVRYVVRIRPMHGSEAHFNEVLRMDPRPPISFTVRLLDADGFEICENTPVVQPSIGVDGKYDLLTGESTFENCDESAFERSSKWGMRYMFPALSDNPQSSATTTPSVTQSTRSDITDRRRVANSSSVEATLTGSDFQSGNIETLSNGSYRVTRSAEKMTILLWESPDKVRIECQGNECTATNLRTGESVHIQRMH
ncbi:MAG: hypothetical protein KGK08_12370 [Acidobacteriota bacterium]|nr:hypothetical protein [Acidobacteriota bacterium]